MVDCHEIKKDDFIDVVRLDDDGSFSSFDEFYRLYKVAVVLLSEGYMEVYDLDNNNMINYNEWDRSIREIQRRRISFGAKLTSKEITHFFKIFARNKKV